MPAARSVHRPWCPGSLCQRHGRRGCHHTPQDRSELEQLLKTSVALADRETVKLDKVARAAVPNETVMAAGIFQAAGSMTARHSGFGEFSVRRREREERASSGLSFKRYMLLVLTPSRLYIFDARSHMTRWKANRTLAMWDRSAIRAKADTKSMTVRLSLEIPSESRRVELEAPKAR